MLPWKTCVPHRKIAFAKTHKTASSTVQNVLLRYGLANSVEFLLPAAHNYLGNMLKPFTIENLDRDGEREGASFLTILWLPGSCTNWTMVVKLSDNYCTVHINPTEEVLSGRQGGKEKCAMARDTEEVGRRLRHQLFPLQVEWYSYEGIHFFQLIHLWMNNF